MDKNFKHKFYVGDWLVEPAMGRISQGEKEVVLRPKVMELLIYLSDRQDTVVGHEELLETVWDGTIVTDSSLYHCMNLLREALGDDKRHPEYITTISRRGYRLIAPVKLMQNDELQRGFIGTVTSSMTSFRLLGLVMLVMCAIAIIVYLTLPTLTSTKIYRPSIAVLAFSDLSPNGDQEYFADGISDEIINLLVKTDSMKVTGSTSSFSFKEKAVSLPEIANQLNVGHVLEGSISKSGNKFKITAQLNDSKGERIWSQTYKRELRDIFVIQEEIAEAIISALQTEILGEIITVNASSTDSLEAFDLYLKGLQASRIFSFESLAITREYLEASIALAPEFKLAKLLLATVITDQVITGAVPAEVNLLLATSIVEKLLKTHENSPQVYIAMSYVMKAKREKFDSLRMIRKARDLGANSAEFYHVYAWALRVNNYSDEAMEKYKQAVALDPINASNYLEIASMNMINGQIDGALDYFKRASVIAPKGPTAWSFLAQLLARYKADFKTAISYHMKAIANDPLDPEMIDLLTAVYISLQDFENARHWSDRSMLLGEGTSLPVLYESQLLLVMGEKQEAVDLIEKALADPSIEHRWNSKVRLVRRAAAIYASMGNYKAGEAVFLNWIAGLKDLQAAPTIESDAGFDRRVYFALSRDKTSISPSVVLELASIYRLMGQDIEANNLMRHLSHITQDYILEHRHKEILNWDLIYLAGYAAVAGRNDEALTLLEEAVEKNALYEWQMKFLYNPALYSLLKEPRFIALISKIKAEIHQQRQLIKNTDGLI